MSRPIKKSQLIFCLTITSGLLIACPAQISADNDDMRTWQLNERRYQLLEQEKLLLKQNDDMELKAFQLKKQLRHTAEELDLTFNQLKVIRQKLVDVQNELR